MVPLFGDMQIAPFNYVRRSKNFDPAKWPLANTNNTHPQSDLLSSLQQIRDDHLKYISELARYSNEVCERGGEGWWTQDILDSQRSEGK